MTWIEDQIVRSRQVAPVSDDHKRELAESLKTRIKERAGRPPAQEVCTLRENLIALAFSISVMAVIGSWLAFDVSTRRVPTAFEIEFPEFATKTPEMQPGPVGVTVDFSWFAPAPRGSAERVTAALDERSRILSELDGR